MSANLREQVDSLIAAGDTAGAVAALGRLWQSAPGPALAGVIVNRFEQLRPRLSLTPCRLAILRSFTVEPAIPLLRAMAFIGGIDLTVHLGDFNTYVQDVLDPSGWLYQFKPDVVLLAAQTRDAVPALWDDFADLDQAGVDAAVQRTIQTFTQLAQTFRAHCQAHLIIHSLQAPALPSQGLLDQRSESGQVATIGRINEALARLCRESQNVYLLDYNALIARRGEAHWYDARKWVTARMPIAATELIHLANEWLRFLHPLTGRVCKCLAVDLDNTLWGGVIGEDGMNGIKLDDAYPGAAFRALQRAILDLHRRGILLAVCSKNNLADAMEAIEKHPGMILRPEHFAALRINWTDKSTNLTEIAKELNIGIDAVAFLDDNPVEREWVRGQGTGATIIELPKDPMLYAQTLRESPIFERLNLTEEDKSRGRYYAEQRLRTQLEQSATSLEDFYRSLQMVVRIEPVNAATHARAAQLTQKTNQFNLTTRRYTEQQLSEMLADPTWNAYTIAVTDRFGDNGIVGVVITHLQNQVCVIDTFLLSCRVIGRTVETALLATVAARAAEAGARKLTGQFIPTKKNAPCKDFYKQHGFACVEEKDGTSVWELSLTPMPLQCPPWIQMQNRQVLQEK